MQVLQLSSEQVLALAPDSGSAANGKKLANTRHWKNLGQNAEAVWGECQGSALYQVRVDLATFTVKCTCPSHKFPCKHGIALLLLVAENQHVPSADPPDWVKDWLSKRAASSMQHKREKAAVDAQAPARDAKRNKRIQNREALILAGLDTLDLWMNDLIRN